MRAEVSELATLAVRAAKSDQLAFRRLVEHVTPTLYRVALRVVRNQADAWDIVQETCVRAWQKLPGLRDPESVHGWMCQIARHAAIERIRQRARHQTECLAEDSIGDESLGPEEATASAELSVDLCQALHRLREKHRVVLLLREVDEMSYQEIAGALGCSVGTVESRLHRARVALTKELGRLEKRQEREAERSLSVVAA